MPDSVKRNWLKKHGKSKYIDFDDAERRELRRYFDAIDADGSGKWIMRWELLQIFRLLDRKESFSFILEGCIWAIEVF